MSSDRSRSARKKKRKPPWYFVRNGVEQGPFRPSDVKNLVRSGELLPTDFLRRADMRKAVPAASLRKLFRRVPTAKTRKHVTRSFMLVGAGFFLALAFNPQSPLTAVESDVGRLLYFLGFVIGLAVLCSGVCFGVVGLGRTYAVIPFHVAPPKDRSAGDTVGVEDSESVPSMSNLGALDLADDSASGSLPEGFQGTVHAVAFAGISLACVVALGLLGRSVWLTFSSNSESDFIPVSGHISYLDESSLPVPTLLLTFYPEDSAVDDKGMSPRPGVAMADGKSNAFHAVTTRKHGDGLKPGVYRVTVHLPGRVSLPATILGEEYGDATRSPLRLNVDQSPIRLLLDKPKELRKGKR